MKSSTYTREIIRVVNLPGRFYSPVFFPDDCTIISSTKRPKTVTITGHVIFVSKRFSTPGMFLIKAVLHERLERLPKNAVRPQRKRFRRH